MSSPTATAVHAAQKRVIQVTFFVSVFLKQTVYYPLTYLLRLLVTLLCHSTTMQWVESASILDRASLEAGVGG